MLKQLKKLIRWARVTKSGSDDGDFPVQQIEYQLGKVGNCFILMPYGMHANASEDSLVAMFSMNGDSANRAGMPTNPQSRPKMAADEICLYHPKTQSIIHLRSISGDLDIDVVKGENGNININAVKCNITASDSININAPDTNITGNLTVTGDTTLSATVTSNGKDISDTHTHIGSLTAGTGAQSTTGVPN